jgi:hypothetical protein
VQQFERIMEGYLIFVVKKGRVGIKIQGRKMKYISNKETSEQGKCQRAQAIVGRTRRMGV